MVGLLLLLAGSNSLAMEFASRQTKPTRNKYKSVAEVQSFANLLFSWLGAQKTVTDRFKKIEDLYYQLVDGGCRFVDYNFTMRVLTAIDLHAESCERINPPSTNKKCKKTTLYPNGKIIFSLLGMQDVDSWKDIRSYQGIEPGLQGDSRNRSSADNARRGKAK